MRELWRLLRQQASPRLMLPMFGLATILCLLAFTSWWCIAALERETTRFVERQDLMMAAASSDVTTKLERIDTVLQQIRFRYRQAADRGDATFLTALTPDRMQLAKLGIVALVVADRDGTVSHSVRLDAVPPSAPAWLPALRRLEARGEQHVMLGAAVADGDAPIMIPMLLPLGFQGAHLDGAVIAFLSLQALQQLPSVRMAPPATALHLMDPALQNSVTLAPGRHGAQLPTDPGRLALEAATRTRGGYTELSGNGPDVYVAFRVVAQFDTILVARFDLHHALSAQRQENTILIVVVVLVCLFLQVGVITLLHHVDALHDAHRTLRATEEKERRRAHELDATLDAMIQGCIVVDTARQITVANSVFSELARLPAGMVVENTAYDALLGLALERGDFVWSKTISDMPPAISGLGLDGDQRTEIVRSDGTVIDVRTKPLADGGFIVTLTDITEHRRSLQRIRKLAEEDPLTELANRRQFQTELQHEADRLPFGVESAVLLLDLDRFKAVNDTLGHPVGDKLLTAVARRLLQTARSDDVVARLGGDEFAVLQRNLASPEAAMSLADRIVERISAPYEIESHKIDIGVSIGIAVMPRDGSDPDQIMKAADVALYHAKSSGRGAAHLFRAPMRDLIDSRLRLEADLRRAVAERQFEVHYQPIHDLSRSGGLAGFEALCRWHHPERGIVSPAEFIPLAEDTGLIVAIGTQVIQDAIAAAARWSDDLRVAINLSPVQLRHPGLLTLVTETLHRHRVRPARLELEVTEAVLLDDDPVIAANLAAFDATGIELAMDDFGTGYSSLSYLRRFPFRKVKIDRSFVRSIDTSSEGKAIVEASIMLARRLGLVATAEGIETIEELETVRALGCDQAQGFYLGRPMPPLAADALAIRHGNSAAAETA